MVYSLLRALERVKKKERKFSSPRGDIDPEKAGYAVGYFDGVDISYIYNNLTQALVGRVRSEEHTSELQSH